MPGPNIVRISEIGECVAAAIYQIREGVLAARAAGIEVELPEKVDFTMLVAKEVNGVSTVSSETQKSTEIQGGAITETQGGATTDIAQESGSENRSQTETSRKEANNAHNETNNEEIDTTQA